MTLVFCGDIMPGGVLPYQDNYITAELREFMLSFDFRIGTLESAIGKGMPFDPIKLAGRQNIIYARDEDFFRVKELRFDVLSLANNHVWDLGEDGLKNTIKILKDNGVKYCGAGMNAQEASLPAVIEKDGVKVAIYSYCMYNSPWLGHVKLAEGKKAGINPLNINIVIEDIKKAKERYDYVIVMPHWGREYLFEPLPECIQMAKKMIRAGADAVFGSHPHYIQPLVKYKGKPICYSLGNFLFPDFFMRPPRPIWYPDSDNEVQGIKEVVGYPFPIDAPIKQVWNPVSRYGCILGLELNKEEEMVTVHYVHSSNNNIESLEDLPRHIHFQLQKASRIISNTPYRIAVYGKRTIKRFTKRITEKLGKW